MTAVALAVIISFQSVGWLLAWQGLQFEVRLEAKRFLFQGENKLKEGTFHQVAFQKLKVGRREIRLEGRLFDYRILSETCDSVRVTLYRDHKEEALLSALGQAFKSADNTKTPSSSPVALWIAKWLGSDFILHERPGISSGIEPICQRPYLPTLLFAAQSAPSVFAPPPEVQSAGKRS